MMEIRVAGALGLRSLTVLGLALAAGCASLPPARDTAEINRLISARGARAPVWPARVIAFAALMLLAAANKWRFGPAMERGESRAVRSFRRTVVIEGFLIIGVLAATATMTSFFSPEH